MAKNNDDKRIIATNSKAFHDYFIDSRMECGIALAGTEVKKNCGFVKTDMQLSIPKQT